MKWLLLSLVLVSSLRCAGTSSDVPVLPEPASAADDIRIDPKIPITALHGDGKLIVVLVPLQVPEGQAPAVLLRVTGIEHPLAGVTFRAVRDVSGPNVTTWQIRLDGRILTVLADWVTQPGITLMSLPGYEEEKKLRPDAILVDAVKPEVLVADHKKRLADGSLAELERFHREPKVALKEEAIQQRKATLEEKCQTQIAVSMDWTSVPDEDIRTTSHCYGLLGALALVCVRDEASRRAVESHIKELRCVRAASTSLSFAADKVLQRREAREMALYQGIANARTVAYKALVDLLKLTPTVLRSADGLVIVFDPDAKLEGVHAGRDGVLYRQKSGSTYYRDKTLWDGGKFAKLSVKAPGKWEAVCGGAVIEFLEVDDKFREDFLASAKFEPRLWKRASLALARDDRGTYYYVDRFNEDNGGKGFRVFKGPRGALRLTKLVDIVDDSDGMIFATTRGKLRLIINKNRSTEARWIEGKKERSLTNLSLSENAKFIFGDLGVYAEDKYGSICDL